MDKEQNNLNSNNNIENNNPFNNQSNINNNQTNNSINNQFYQNSNPAGNNNQNNNQQVNNNNNQVNNSINSQYIENNNQQVNLTTNEPVINNQNNNNKFKSLINKKTIIIISCIILGIVVIVFAFKFLGNSSKSINAVDTKSLLDPNKPIMIEENNKYGLISSKGKIILEPIYSNISEYYNNYAITTKKVGDETIYQIVDINGNIMVDNINDKPYYVEGYNNWVYDDKLYNSNFKVISDENLYIDYEEYGYLTYSNYNTNISGIMNGNGKSIYEWEGTLISLTVSNNTYNDKELYSIVKDLSDKTIIINLKNGKVMKKLENPDKSIYAEDDGIFKAINSNYDYDEWYWFVDNKLAYYANEVIDEMSVYDYENRILQIDYGYDYEELGKEKRIYYYDAKNNKMLDEEPKRKAYKLDDINRYGALDNYDEILEEFYGYRTVYENEKYGINKKDSIILPNEYDRIDFIDLNVYNYFKDKGKELVIVRKDKKAALLNLKNKKSILSYDNASITDNENSSFLNINLYEDSGYTPKETIIYNLITGKQMSIPKNSTLDVNSNYIIVKDNNKKVYYNTDLEEIYSINI